jgi:hypothetical protein
MFAVMWRRYLAATVVALIVFLLVVLMVGRLNGG